MITIKDISKRFGKLQALDKVNLQLRAGECIALIGPNGCGKTTLIKTILGMVRPDAGTVLFKGKDVRNEDAYRRQIGYMPQIGRYPEHMTVGQVLNMIKGIRSDETALDLELYDQFEIEGILQKKMRTLSGGTTQKVSALLAFLFRPRVLILDEPTAGLDPVAADLLKEKIIKERNAGRLILITSHILSELEDLVSHVVFLQEGKLILHKSAPALKSDTGANSLAQSIVHLLKNVAT
ncbi:ABC transporter ATP-binding protein [Niabella soli]|uniref:Copper ABC transporter ATP-binding protein n=1 Tax=Niabella soli DSM 19437 TaxID=929713 RepID=W0F1T7_9BACT|nr:ABC transporter ATP-binding protein [Niabella soli]AHF15286.1 copper ABC transporter ATP-binding protein [Niabella soli DSM 19437]